MLLPYRLVNVFTRHHESLSGNPLCVFEDAAALTDAQMQALALQFNLSETTFVMPSARADARVRIFTPTFEMPFAGHPTLGTAHVVRQMKSLGDAVSLELNVGVIPVTADGDFWELRANPATSRVPAASADTIATSLGLHADDLVGQPLWVTSGSEQLIVPVRDAEAVRRAQPSFDALRAATSDGPRPNAYIFASTGEHTRVARYFFSKTGAILEDPATGSATANFGGWLLANHTPLPFTSEISQGEQIGRPSTLRLRIDEARQVFVAGEVIEIGRGTLTV